MGDRLIMGGHTLREQSMSDLIVSNIEQLLEGWIEAERNGVQFPVPFDMAWPMAGYSRKDSAKRNGLKGLVKDEHYSTKRWSVKHSNGSGASSKELIELSMAGFEHLCLMADTPEGKAVRDLYRQAKAKWDIVKKIAPEVAAETELMHLKIELAKIEAQRSQIDWQLIQFRHIITTTLPEPIQQKILGYSEVKTVEYIDRTIAPSGDTYDGVGITYIQKRYGFKSTKTAWDWLESIGCGKQSGHWETQLAAVERQSLPRDLLSKLDELAQTGTRQPFLGE